MHASMQQCRQKVDCRHGVINTCMFHACTHRMRSSMHAPTCEHDVRMQARRLLQHESEALMMAPLRCRSCISWTITCRSTSLVSQLSLYWSA